MSAAMAAISMNKKITIAVHPRPMSAQNFEGFVGSRSSIEGKAV